MPSETTAAGWHGEVSEFLNLDEARLLEAFGRHQLHYMGMAPDGLQTVAWRSEFAVLQAVFVEVLHRNPTAARWHIVFGFVLPRERGRRPGVVVLTGSQVIVLEFKEAEHPQAAHVDQVAACARDLSEYHAASHDKLVDPVLVPTHSRVPRPFWRDEWGKDRPEPREIAPARTESPSPGRATWPRS